MSKLLAQFKLNCASKCMWPWGLATTLANFPAAISRISHGEQRSKSPDSEDRVCRRFIFIFFYISPKRRVLSNSSSNDKGDDDAFGKAAQLNLHDITVCTFPAALQFKYWVTVWLRTNTRTVFNEFGVRWHDCVSRLDLDWKHWRSPDSLQALRLLLLLFSTLLLYILKG